MKLSNASAAAPPGPAVTTQVVGLAAGPCFGQPGQNAYLMAKGLRGWKGVLPKPGSTHPHRHRTGSVMQLTLLPGKDVAVPVRFGGDASPQHGLLLRFGAMEHDGTVAGHLIAQVGQNLLAAWRAIVWDPVLRSFGWANGHEAERLVEKLDAVAELTGMVARGVTDTCEAAMTFLDGMLQLGFILIGGIGTILVGYLLYYWLWVVLAKALLLWLILPGLALAVACSYVHHQRMQRLRTVLFQAAWHAIDPAAYHAP